MEKEKDKVKELRKVEQLKEFRERVGLTQGELSKALSVANNTVSRWELGQRSIPEFLPLALETIERRLSESTAGSKAVSTVGSSAGELLVADIMKRFDAGETTVRRWLKQKHLAGKTENDLLEFQNSEWFQTLKRNENVK
jgi:transcriptional regulator with XRE-family HTH domain